MKSLLLFRITKSSAEIYDISWNWLRFIDFTHETKIVLQISLRESRDFLFTAIQYITLSYCEESSSLGLKRILINE